MQDFKYIYIEKHFVYKIDSFFFVQSKHFLNFYIVFQIIYPKEAIIPKQVNWSLPVECLVSIMQLFFLFKSPF